MGRHSAAPSDELRRPASVGDAVTDPRLFDRPLPAARGGATSARTTRPDAQSAAQSEPRFTARPPAPPHAVAPLLPAAQAHRTLVEPQPTVALPFQPVAVRGMDPRNDDRIVPQMSTPSILRATGQQLSVRPSDHRYARTGPIPIITDAPEPRTPSAFTRKREIALAAAALAVVGAMSGAAALLPSNASSAEAAGKIEPVSAPMPGASGGTGNTCISPIQLKQAMRHLHRHRTHPSRAVGTPLSVVAPSASPSTSDSPSATPSSSATPTSSSSASSDPSDTTSTSTPALPTTGLDLMALVKSALSGSMLGLNAGTYVMNDFSSQNHGVTLGKVGLKGAGIDKTLITMSPHSSTKASVVPTAYLSTNPLYLMSTIGGTPGLSDFTLKGTDQGHLFGGLFIGQTSDARVSNLKISGIPGNASVPPGETFSLNDWRTDGSVYDNINIDGGGTDAVDFGSNSTTNITVKNSSFTGSGYSSGMAMWQTKNITLDDVTLKDNRSGINFERASGNITINRPVLSNNRLYDFQFGTDQDGANVVINDPVLAPGQKIVINAPLQYHGVTNGQKRSNIHVYVNGVDKTSSLVQYK